MDIQQLKVGDPVIVYRDGHGSKMIVRSIDPPGSAMRAVSAGPWINAHIRPGGYAVGFDLGTIAGGFLRVYSPAEVNANGTPYELIDGDEYCLECERDNREGHYDTCPLKES